jgi:hypothetical protein
MRATEHSVSCQNAQGWNEIPFGLVAETEVGLSSPTYSQRHTSGWNHAYGRQEPNLRLKWSFSNPHNFPPYELN